MAPSSRPEHHINLNYIPQLPQPPHSGSSTGNTSPVEPPNSGSLRFSGNTSTAGARLGAASPSHDYSGRLFSKRAREIQAQEGLTPQMWGPPTSGNSTPLRETIPESPSADSFPDFNNAMPETTSPAQPPNRRARAGTLPSRFSSTTAPPGLMSAPSLLSKSSRPTPSTSPFKPGPGTPTDTSSFNALGSTNAAAKSALLSRLRAGSMPQRPGYLPPAASPFGNSMFSGGWASNRDRSSTLQSIASVPSNGPGSPMSAFSRDSLADTDVKTLDYLGLVDTPQPARATLAPSDIELLLESQRNANNHNLNSANRFRSYSVNAKEKYAEDEDDQYGAYSGTITPAEANALLIHEAVRQHNLEVQAFANIASNARPRARTAGVLDTPRNIMRNYLPAMGRFENGLGGADLTEDAEYNLTEAVKKLHLPASNLADEGTLEGPTRSLWLGNIPSSTTVSSLQVIFSQYGSIESTRVLTHKNCGFVNYENLDSAIQAKQTLNGKEIFPGAGPVRIGFAKIPSAAATPGHNGLFPSPSPDPLSKAQAEGATGSATTTTTTAKMCTAPANVPLTTPELSDIRNDIIQIVKELGATDEEQLRITTKVEKAVQFNNYVDEIPSVEELGHTRIHDAPRLREIRKRIDNGSCSKEDIEHIATAMIPEIAELASDYLGNTVVQKLFEFCEEPTKEAMLREIAPHLAKIGVHKNGTWAAQKIIDVSKSETMQRMVVDAVQPYALALFNDQFGNYVMQGCLKYQHFNGFIFEVMLGRLWDLAQGRFGARAMRACLESHFATKDQQRMVAATIALHSVQLATNANGALLLTWFLDTCTFPRRRTVLAPRLVPHIVHLCTHKVAYLTVLKIINQRNEPEARDTILQALFFSPNDQVLESILGDQNCGATLIFKVLTTPFFDEQIRADVVQNVRNVLLRIKAQPQQGYKRLMDEVGLSTRGGPGHRDHSATRPASKDSAGPGQSFYQGGAPGYDPVALQRTASMDSNGFDHYAMGAGGPYMQNMQATSAQQQLQYQQLMARQSQFYPQMNGFQPPVPGMDPYRNASPAGSFNGSPMMQPANLAGQGMMPNMAGMYPYGGYMPPQQQQAAGGNQRRGRVSRNASPAGGRR
ncbi:RNA binding protein [Clathrospora elynae]|uniref:RNA binding protein n=1 Tax=Clathrospora elynae TaxID=706981 RepID=A0A6A5SQF6_9PLEO|nr:RNA binding protein [Clathrospora elynae]